MTARDLHIILRAIRSGSAGYKEVVALVHYSRSIAESYLVAHRNSVLQLCDAHGISLTDLATDCIADVFHRDKEGGLVDLIRFMEHSIESSDEALTVRYRHFIILRMRSQLARTYAQIDAMGAKISRNLKRNLQRHPSLRLVSDFRGYVVEPLSSDPLNDRPAFPLSHLERVLSARLSIAHTIPEILSIVCDEICRQEEFRRSIPLFHLVNMVRMIYVSREEEEEVVPEIQLSAEEIAAVQRMICVELDNRIFTEYVRKEKLTFDQAKKVSLIIREIVSGWWDGEREHESVSAITQRMLNISPHEYQMSFQTKIEYLVKLAKDRFRDSLERDL